MLPVLLSTWVLSGLTFASYLLLVLPYGLGHPLAALAPREVAAYVGSYQQAAGSRYLGGGCYASALANFERARQLSPLPHDLARYLRQASYPIPAAG